MKRAATLALFGFLMTTPSAADVTEFSATSMNCPVPSLSNYVVNDIKIDFTGQYTGAQALVELTAGSIFQYPGDYYLPQTAAWIGLNPGLECDTFVGQGSPIAPSPFGDPSPGGGAIDLSGDPVPEFGTTRINQAWNAAGGVTILDQNDFLIMRLTMSHDAQGTAKFLAAAAGTPSVIEWYVRNGIVTPIPEPAGTMVVACAVIAATIFVRRRCGS
jgi:hypothetical protein